jgi:hypothetical protein
LPSSVDKLLRATGLSGGFAEPSKQCRHHSADSGLRTVAIKTERGSDAPDHVGFQELHDE